MRRDLDLIREMMLALESNSRLNGRALYEDYASGFFPSFTNDDDTLAYHLMQIIDEGWVEGKYLRTPGKFILVRLTADGHDFIDAARQDTIWEKAKAGAKAAGGGTLRLVWDFATSLAKAEIERQIGIR